MELKLNNKTALVTAASSGLGFSIAHSLAKEGVKCVICSRNKDKITKAEKEIRDLTGTEIYSMATDITSESDTNKLIDFCNDKLGKVDILVLNTGHPPTDYFTKLTENDWDKGIDLILRPFIRLSKAFLPKMQNNKFGRLFFIGSIFGIEPEPSSIIQSTLRTGLNSFSKCIASETGKDGITSNVICPGYFDTPLLNSVAKLYADKNNKDIKAVLKGWKELAPTNSFGNPDDLGDFIAYLSSDKGKFITGTSIALDGGILKGW